MSLVEQTLAAIVPLDVAAERAASRRLDSLTKPPGSLGYLEDFVRRYAAIRHDAAARFGGGALMGVFRVPNNWKLDAGGKLVKDYESDEYRAAMVRQDKSLIRITIDRWGPIATGGFPARLGG